MARRLVLSALCLCVFIKTNGFAQRSSLRESRELHTTRSLDHETLLRVADTLEDLHVLNTTLENILLPRVVGTESHARVKNFIIEQFKNLMWDVEKDSFVASTPIGQLSFTNIVAVHNPKAKRFLDVACHYDSKYFPGRNNFVGATDSAVPCAMMIQMAHTLDRALHEGRNNELSLRFIFFDGEEAFRTWTRSDSIYGSRHLAKKWKETPYPEGGPTSSQLDRIDMLVLLDLLGAKNPEFYSFFADTHKYYSILVNAESKLKERNLLRSHQKRYFQRKSTDSYLEDDHIPFLEQGVPILHVITIPFPPEWHTPRDDHSIIDYHTTANLVKILTVFIAEYLNLSI